ncbi:hypothetical protein IAT38_002396 [Cryptococcus sp. DSM 104549]
MSISLPNGTLLAAPSSSQVQLTAAVTRILHLANFSPELKTRDLQLMFKEWDADKGGYRIKWLDDVNALVVFADAGVAKRAYLSFLLHPPPHFQGQIRPYDRPDAAQIIQSLAARALGHRSSLSTAANGLTHGHPGAAGSLSFPFPANNDPAAPQVHSRAMSVTNAHKPNGSISGIPPFPNGAGSISGPGLNAAPAGAGPAGISRPQRIGHHRTGSASSSWARQSLSGSLSGGAGISSLNSLGALGSQSFSAGGGGALSFGGGGALAPRLPTHSEGSAPASRSASSSSGGDPVIVVDPSASKGWKGAGPGLGGGGSAAGGEGATRGPRGEGAGARRESVSAEKALREVQKALASVEAQG